MQSLKKIAINAMSVSVIVGCFALLKGVADLVDTGKMLVDGESTYGVVEHRVSDYSAGSGVFYEISVTYTDHRGNERSFDGRQRYGSILAPEKGERIRVMYNPNEGDALVATPWQLFGAPLAMIAVGCLLIQVIIPVGNSSTPRLKEE